LKTSEEKNICTLGQGGLVMADMMVADWFGKTNAITRRKEGGRPPRMRSVKRDASFNILSTFYTPMKGAGATIFS
jgi:hypothetical protein